ncbi:MAG: RNA pyrophosphohydrolase [Sulfuricurvum sp.]
MQKDRLYRPNVAVVILSSAYPQKKEIFLAQRCDLKGVWQFPQGGIDDGEEPLEAMFRELSEEIGTSEVELIAEYPRWLSYDFPTRIAQNMTPFVGQKQRYFLVRLKDDSLVDIATSEPEFDAFKFVQVEEVLSLGASFKKDVYSEVIDYFMQKGYL